MLKKAVIVLALILWPLNLILSRDLPKLQLPETIFVSDYEAKQLILRNTYLYPNVLTARIFQNKARVYLNKFTNNFFALTDPNNYFFGFHPQPIVPDNKNLFKFPFVAIIFFLYGLYTIKGYKYKNCLAFVTTLLLLVLSVLKNFDGYDFVLWVPVSLVIIHGIGMLKKDNKKVFTITSIVFLIFAIPEIIRAFIK